MLIIRVKAGTECELGKEQCGFKQDSGCMDELVAVRQVCDKYIENGNMYLWRLWISNWSMI